MKFYIDREYHCHTTNPNGDFQEIEHEFFDGKCDTFIEGYSYEPEHGKIYPWKPFDTLEAAQREYERNQIAEYEAALSEIETALGVTE